MADSEAKVDDSEFDVIQAKIRRKFDKHVASMDPDYITKCGVTIDDNESDDDEDNDDLHDGKGKKLEQLLVNNTDEHASKFIQYIMTQAIKRFDLDVNNDGKIDDEEIKQREAQLQKLLLKKEDYFKLGTETKDDDKKNDDDMDSYDNKDDERYSWVTPAINKQIADDSVKMDFSNSTLLPRINDKLWKIARPKRRIDLALCMKYAASMGKNIKAAGSMYAESDVTFTDGLLIDMWNGCNLPYITINTDILNDYGKELYNSGNLFLTEAGSNAKGINEILWNTERSDNRKNIYIDPETKKLKYKMLIDTIGDDQGCVVGTGQVGASGYGKPGKYGGISHYIKSMQLVTLEKNGDDFEIKYYQIEPSDKAIHDKTKFEEYYDGSDPVFRPKIELIQDFDTYNATINNVGLFGVIYSAYMEVMDAHYLERICHQYTYDEFKTTECQKLFNNDELHRFQVIFTPYTTVFGKYKDSPVVGVVTWKEWDPTKDPGSISETPGAVPVGLYAAIVWIVKAFPRITPLLLTEITKMQAPAKNFIYNAPQNFAAGTGKTLPLTGNGIGFGCKPTTENLIKAMDIYMERMNEIKKTKPKGKKVISGPIAYRFSAPNPGILSFANNDYGGFWCEQTGVNFDKYGGPHNKILKKLVGYPKYLFYMFDEIQKLYQNDPKSEGLLGKLHLGLNINFDLGYNIFKNQDKSKMDIFINKYKKFNSTQLFCNQFSKISGLDKLAGFNNPNTIPPEQTRPDDDPDTCCLIL